MKFFARRKILKQANYLELTPMRLVAEEIEPDNLVTVLMPKFKTKFMQKYFLPRSKSAYVKIKLDELGSATWLAIDGKKKVSNIIAELQEQFGDKIQPVETRVTTFLTMLYQQELISFLEITKPS